MSSKQPTHNQISRFQHKHQDCAGPYSDGSYVSVVTGKRYTAGYIARAYSDKPYAYVGIYVGN